MQEQNNATMFEVHQSLAPEIHLIFRTDDPRESEGWVRDIRESISRWAALGRSFDGSKSGWLCVSFTLPRNWLQADLAELNLSLLRNANVL